MRYSVIQAAERLEANVEDVRRLAAEIGARLRGGRLMISEDELAVIAHRLDDQSPEPADPDDDPEEEDDAEEEEDDDDLEEEEDDDPEEEDDDDPEEEGDDDPEEEGDDDPGGRRRP